MTLLKYFLISLLLLSICLYAQVDCTYNGFQLYGKVKIVEYNYDLTIEIVEHNADIDVKIVEYFPDECGEWKLVEHFEDVRIKILKHNADLKVKFVQNFPGIK